MHNTTHLEVLGGNGQTTQVSEIVCSLVQAVGGLCTHNACAIR